VFTIGLPLACMIQRLVVVMQVGVETDQIVLSSHIHFHICKTNTDEDTDIVKYKYGADVTQIRIKIGCFIIMEWIRIIK
jgi:hypothetical protein